MDRGLCIDRRQIQSRRGQWKPLAVGTLDFLCVSVSVFVSSCYDGWLAISAPRAKCLNGHVLPDEEDAPGHLAGPSPPVPVPTEHSPPRPRPGDGPRPRSMTPPPAPRGRMRRKSPKMNLTLQAEIPSLQDLCDQRVVGSQPEWGFSSRRNDLRRNGLRGRRRPVILFVSWE